MNINEQLYSIAMKSNQRAKYAAIIIHRNRVVGIGYNFLISNSSNVSQQIYETYKHSIHAERNAIMNVKDKTILPFSKIIIVKLCDGNIVQAKPCEMCKNLLDKYKLNKIYTIVKDKLTNCNCY
jgi:deoxycytidylate deaminase